MLSLVTLLQFIAGLSIMVGIHELGHLLFAKLFKMRVHSYMIGFPPKICKFKWGETEYALGAVPLGGAVQIAGMVDASVDSLPSAPQPWEFRAKTPWQRLVVILGGIFFNLVSGSLIYIVLSYIIGYTYLPKNEVNKYGVRPDEIGLEIGFQEGDKLIKINGKDFEDFSDFMSASLLLGNDSYYTVDRNGVELILPIPDKIVEKIAEKKAFIPFLYPIFSYSIGSVTSSDGAGLMVGDQILTIAAQPAVYVHQLQNIIKSHIGQKVPICYLRNGLEMQTCVSIDAENGLKGIQIKIEKPSTKKIDYSWSQSISAGLKEVMTCMHHYYLGIWSLITGKLSVKKSLGGPISIATIFGNDFALLHFWKVVGYLSITIALTNLLPIPVLDGGHALVICCEWIFGRKPSDKFLKISYQIGMAFVLLLMVYAFGNDIRKLLGSS